MRNKGTLLYLLALWMLTFFFVSPTHALTLIDLRQEIVVEPGEEQIITVEFLNETTATVTLSPVVDSFSIDAETGRAIFGANAEAESWVEPEVQRVVLEPGASGELSFVVRVPGSAEPGTHYIGLFGEGDTDDGQVVISSRLGSLLFLQIAGTQKESMIVSTFGGDRDLYFESEIAYDLQLQNKGSVRVEPEGTIQVTDMFGRIVGTKVLNLESRVLYAGMTMDMSDVFEDVHWTHAGPLTLSLFARYGVTAQTLSDTTTLWYIPWQLVLIFLFFVLLLLMHRGMRLRRKNRQFSKKNELTKPNSFI